MCYNFLKFVKWNTGCWVVSTIQQQTTRDIERKLISHSSWRKNTPWEATWDCQCRVQIVRQDLRHIRLLGSVGRVLWGSQVRTWLVDSNQRILLKPTRVLCKGLTRCTSPGRLLIRRTVGKVISGTRICVWQKLLSRVCASMRRLVSTEGLWKLLGRTK